MKTVSNQIDENLAHLAWSLWSELGVAGLERRHSSFLIAPEELIILTSALSEFDPRLRDEALDWCIHYHRYISSIRLHILAKKYGDYIAKPFSIFSATLNATADIRTKWAVLTKSSSLLNFKCSRKSILRSFEAPSMINFRLKSLFGVSAKADVLAFLLSDKRTDFVASDLMEIGYSKRRLAAILEDLALTGIFSEKKARNQLHYTFVRKNLFINLLGGLPLNKIHWDRILAVLLPLREFFQNMEDTPVSMRVIDLRNLLTSLSSHLLQIGLTPPPLQNDLEGYWKSAVNWILDFTGALSRGEF